ncbi:MAG: AAA family ATPase [Gammaproteobacteria bacterium]|nr:AAA family ATPase [Gammaproteobacteria bacterium]MCY4274176.1 AAA family ATPase [Gammaproteobacteria bacterium]
MNQFKENHFPFSALEGQKSLQTALLLGAIDPLIGGVLIDGPRGTAKSTAARGLADLLDGGRLVDLPLAASEEQLIGSLNIEVALQDGRVDFKPGLLAAADNGVLYVDEVNLLADHLVDALLDVCASGINRIERDGISHQHPTRFVLIGTMNPEEGELRPQLLDRFGLYLQLPSQIEPSVRQRIVKVRLAFDHDPVAFIARFQAEQNTLRERLKQARKRLTDIEFTDEVTNKAAGICYHANVEGVRADLTLLRAARAHAAWKEHDDIDNEDLQAVKDWVLNHRQREPSKAPTVDRSPTFSAFDTSSDMASDNWTDSEQPLQDHADSSRKQGWGAMASQTPDIALIEPTKRLWAGKRPKK